MIYVTGDAHADIDWSKFNTRHFEYKTDKNDFVIIAGDMGVCWSPKQDRYIQKFYNSKPWTTLFVDGNHENFDILNSYPITEWNGGKVHMISDSIIHLMRGQVYDIDGTRIFTMGGAVSHDKEFRKEGISWWRDEMPNINEYKEAERNLKKVDYKVDYIISHCCSTVTQHDIDFFFHPDELTDWFNIIERKVDFKHWYFGHYHKDRQMDEKHTVMYKIIQPIMNYRKDMI